MIALDATTAAILAELEPFGRDNDAAQAERAGKLLNLERPTAELVFLLIRSARRTRVLEIGTSNGYSTLWLAAALHGVEGASPVLTIERDPAKAAMARRNFARAGCADAVTVREGDATAIVADLPGPFDCVFFDADRVSAPGQLRLLWPRLTPDVLLLADNALSHPEEIAGYLAAVDGIAELSSIIVPVGKGLHIAHRR